MIREATAEDGSQLTWRKSSYSSNSSEADCVEVAATVGTVQVRDSKHLTGPRLAFPSAAWAEFVTYTSEG